MLTEPNKEDTQTYNYSSLIERENNIIHSISNMYDGEKKEEKAVSELYMQYEKEEDNVYYYILNLYVDNPSWYKQVYKASENPRLVEQFEGNTSYKAFFDHFGESLTLNTYTFNNGIYSFPDLTLDEGPFPQTLTDLTLEKKGSDYVMSYASVVDTAKYSFTTTFIKFGTTSVTIPPEAINTNAQL